MEELMRIKKRHVVKAAEWLVAMAILSDEARASGGPSAVIVAENNESLALARLRRVIRKRNQQRGNRKGS